MFQCRHSCGCKSGGVYTTSYTSIQWSNRNIHEKSKRRHERCNDDCQYVIIKKPATLSPLSNEKNDEDIQLQPESHITSLQNHHYHHLTNSFTQDDSTEPSSKKFKSSSSLFSISSSSTSSALFIGSSVGSIASIGKDFEPARDIQLDVLPFDTEDPLPCFSYVHQLMENEENSHLLHLKLAPSQLPGVVEVDHNPPSLLRLHHEQAIQYWMPLTEFAVIGSNEENSSNEPMCSFAQRFTPQQKQSIRSPMTEQQIWSNIRNPPSSMIYIRYIKDMEALNVWNRNGKHKDKAEDSIISHFLNTNRFIHHSQSLLNVIPDNWLDLLDPKKKTIKNMKWNFAGLSTPSYYCKEANSFFCLHIEQLFSYFYNYCFQGSTIWYCVLEEERAKFESYLFYRTKQKYPQYLADITESETKFIWALVYAKRLFLNPQEMIEFGVPVHRIHQRVGHAVIGNGSIIHWGICGEDYSINEAINYLPISWLFDGLTQLEGYCQWLNEYISEWNKGVHPGVLTLLFDSKIRNRVANVIPQRWTRCFISSLIAALKNKSIPLTLNEEQTNQICNSCQNILAFLEQQNVRDYYAEHEVTG